METPRGAGGTDGGVITFVVGVIMVGLGAYLLLDSVRITTGGGLLTRSVLPSLGLPRTGTGALIFAPFFLGILLLFFNAKMKTGWILLGLGLVAIGVEVASQIRGMKSTYFVVLMVLIAGGLGLILRSFRDGGKDAAGEKAAVDGNVAKTMADIDKP